MFVLGPLILCQYIQYKEINSKNRFVCSLKWYLSNELLIFYLRCCRLRFNNKIDCVNLSERKSLQRKIAQKVKTTSSGIFIIMMMIMSMSKLLTKCFSLAYLIRTAVCQTLAESLLPATNLLYLQDKIK